VKRLSVTFDVEYSLPVHPVVSDSEFIAGLRAAVEGLTGKSFALVTVTKATVKSVKSKP
jgi:hypothetical protein